MKTKLELTIDAGAPPTDFFDPINAPLLEEFTKFLVDEYSNENILFAQAVREFTEAAPNMTQAQLDARALAIYNQYVSEKGSSQINIDGQTRQLVKENLSKTDIHIFDRSFTTVEKVISRDSMRRFIQTPEYHNAVALIAPVQKEYDVLSHAYQNEPEHNRSHFISELFKQQAQEVAEVEKNIMHYTNGLGKDNTKLELANKKKETLLVRGKALHALVLKRVNPDLEIDSAKRKVQLSQDALDLAESNLAHIAELDSVEKGDILILKRANQEVDYAQHTLNEATKKLEDLMNAYEHKAMPAITPMLRQTVNAHKMQDTHDSNDTNDTKANDAFSQHRPRR